MAEEANGSVDLACCCIWLVVNWRYYGWQKSSGQTYPSLSVLSWLLPPGFWASRQVLLWVPSALFTFQFLHVRLPPHPPH